MKVGDLGTDTLSLAIRVSHVDDLVRRCEDELGVLAEIPASWSMCH
jgi:hypothetical protein